LNILTRTTRAASCHDGLPPPSAAAAAAAGAAAAAVAVGAVVVVAAGGGSPRAELVPFCLRDEKRLATFRRDGDESRRGADLAGVDAAGPPPMEAASAEEGASVTVDRVVVAGAGAGAGATAGASEETRRRGTSFAAVPTTANSRIPSSTIAPR
jgi:hypothetical protein